MNKVIVYSRFMGVIQVVAFMGDKWWNMTKDDRFAPMNFDKPCDEDDIFHYLCDSGDTLLMKDLIGLMGSAAENPEENLEDVLQDRLNTLIANGVKIIDTPQFLNLRFGLFDEGKELKGKTGFSLICKNSSNKWETYFAKDDFETAKDAFLFMKSFIEFFKKHNVWVNFTLFASKNLMEIVGETIEGMKLENDEFNG